MRGGNSQYKFKFSCKIYENPNKFHLKFVGIWQGKKASNPRPTVLETAALPAELFPYILFADSKPKPNEMGLIWEGKRRLRRHSFRGTYVNRGSGVKQASFDVVDRQGLEPRTDGL